MLWYQLVEDKENLSSEIGKPEKPLSPLILFSIKNEKTSTVSMLLSDKKNEKSEESLKCSKKNERWTILS